ncbi:hypothetical protein ACFVVM_04640 [Nocardia sp. NPDC058176]|uniref:hypothetical protein n=1 Tax=Nocardia sp. NPDC058176 TaxID=3346368 RepID=UPI0036D91234
MSAPKIGRCDSAAAALESAVTDPDTDVRAYARRTVLAAGRTPTDPGRAESALPEART